MNRSQAWLAFIFLSTAITSPVFGQEPDYRYDTNKVILPFLSYTPETSLMFGGLTMIQFKPGDASPETRASQVIFSGIYSLNKQLMVELTPNIILPEEKWLFEGRYEYSFFPDLFWGIGPFTKSDDETDIEFRSLHLQQVILKKFGSNLYAGAVLRWSNLSNIEFLDENGLPITDPDIKGSGGSTLPGIGFSVRHDRRNSITYPTKNHYLEITGLNHPGFLGSSHSHSSLLFDARKYVDLWNDERSILAFHFQSRLTSGELPFQEYSRLGGREIMRGYYEGRFRDTNAAQVQAEYRQAFHRRMGFSLFMAAGEVWNRFDEFSLDNPKYSAGAGFRFNLNPADTTNLRIDYGIGKHGSGLYITLGEAF